MADEVARGMSSPEAHSANATTGSFDPAAQDAYWRENYSTRPYVMGDRGYDYYRPAYQYGWQSAAQRRGQPWTAAESDLRAGWDRARGSGTSTWDDVKHAVRDAWDRATHALSGKGESGTATTDAGAKREMSHMNPDRPGNRS